MTAVRIVSHAFHYYKCFTGYFEPRRREKEDEFVVSHIPWLIHKYDCHINVEYSMGVNLFQYLFKYFYKGVNETNWSVRTTPKDSGDQSRSIRKPVDEIKDHERGRYLSSIEAATRIASFHITEKKPAVKRLPIHLPGKQRGQMARKDGSESDGTLLVRYDPTTSPYFGRFNLHRFWCQVPPGKA
jgi:hypothetical protein